MNADKMIAGLLGMGLIAVMTTGTAEAGWLEKATGLRTPEPIRKIAPNGIRLPDFTHSPRSHVTPNSVFNGSSQQTFKTRPEETQNNQYFIQLENQRRERDRQQLQQQQQLQYQQQLRYQQDMMKTQQQTQVIGAILQGIGTLTNQQQNRQNGWNLPGSQHYPANMPYQGHNQGGYYQPVQSMYYYGR